MGRNGNVNGAPRKLPIGIQDFENLRRSEYLYVDKTAFLFKLVHEGKPYFLSRPRRFGKSLFLSTLKAYWEGRKDLFEGLDIIRLEEEAEEASRQRNADPAKQYQAWQPHPVFYFDFNKADFTRETALEAVLAEHLSGWEKIYGDEKKDGSAEEALAQIEEKGYALPYAADKRTLLRVGANFDSGERALTEWKVV